MKTKMVEKEKAKELVEKFIPIIEKVDFFGDDTELRSAKQCALICVDEILEAIDWHEYIFPNIEIEYWQNVKTEIEKFEQ